MKHEHYHFFVGKKKSKKLEGRLITDDTSKYVSIQIINIEVGFLESEIPIIYAKSDTEELTFLNCLIIGRYLGHTQESITLRPQYILTGTFAIPKSKLKFTQLSASITNLNEWFFPGDFSHKLRAYKDVLFDESYTEDLLIGNIPGGIQYKVQLTNSHYGVETHYEMHNHYTLKLNFKKAADIGTCIKALAGFRRFFTIILFAQVEVDYLMVKNVSYKGKSFRALHNYSLKVNNSSAFQSSNKTQIRDYSFKFSDIKHNFNKYYKKYLVKEKTINSVLDHIIESILNEPSVALEYKFQGTCFAMETYHRTLYDQTVMETTLFKQQKKLALNAVNNNEFKVLLSQALSHVNSTRFKDRIRFCFDRVPNLIKAKITDYRHFEKLIKLIGDARNKQVHNVSTPKNEVYLNNFHTYFYLFYKMRFVLYANVLLELGVSESEISDFYGDFSFHNFWYLIQGEQLSAIYEIN